MITQEFSVLYAPLFTTKARYILLWGGRGRGGSYTATNYFTHLITSPKYFRGYLMREIFSDIRESLWRDFKDRIDENETLREIDFDLREHQMSATYKPTGNMLMSKGFKKSTSKRTAKLKSLAGATHVVIEEAEEISEEDFMQLDDTLRSVKADIQIILIFNPPPKKHWIWRKWFTLIDAPVPGYFRAIPRRNPEVLSIFSTYEDNLENINPSTLRQWQDYAQTNPEHYYTIILGYISEGARGRIYRNWQQIAHMPNLYSKFYGLDWGFSGDPLALVECEAHNRQLFVDQKIYESGLTNDDIEKLMIARGVKKISPIVADSAQPKDIEDFRRRGWNIVGAQKGPGSKVSGINFIKQYQVFVTESSKEIWGEQEDYSYALDQYKNPTDDPIEKNDHAMDAINYAMDRVRKPAATRVITPGAQRSTNGRTNYSM